jgi:hypothetical protein
MESSFEDSSAFSSILEISFLKTQVNNMSMIMMQMMLTMTTAEMTDHDYSDKFFQ